MSMPISGDGWRGAKSLVMLYGQVVTAYPSRSKTGDDAMIGDAAHAARTSDHNPNAAGVVCALDLTHDPAGGFDSYAFADMLLANRDERIKYIISNRRIGYGPRSPSHGQQPGTMWRWEPYSGDNPHTEHIHISVGDANFYDKGDPWNISGVAPPIPDSAKPTLRRGSSGDDVKQVQQLVFVDGIFGPITESAVRTFQKSQGLPADGIVGLRTWAALLEAPPAKEAGWQTNILASVFGGEGDRQTSAYDGHLIGDIEKVASLPAKLPADSRLIDVRAGGRVETVKVEDEGPWLVDDLYWKNGTRPLAEVSHDTRTPLTRGPNKGRIANGAGIDLSPALARALGIDGLGRVDWRFHSTEEPTMANVPATVEVPVRSSAASKINWTAAGTAGLAVLTAFGLDIPEPARTFILAGIPVVGGAAIAILRTFFTTAITPASASKLL